MVEEWSLRLPQWSPTPLDEKRRCSALGRKVEPLETSRSGSPVRREAQRRSTALHAVPPLRSQLK